MAAGEPTDLVRHALERVAIRPQSWASTAGTFAITSMRRIHVEEQVTEGDRVASRWIVISRVEDGEIVEDWAASDTVHLIRQVGPWRLLLLGVAWFR